MMKQFLAALLLLSSASVSANAAEPASNRAGIDWSGLFIGLQAGHLDGTSHQQRGAPGTVNRYIDFDGGFAGASIEYLWQEGDFVFGPQAEIAWASTDQDFPAGNNRFLSGVEWFGSAGGKAGMAFDNVLLFGTAGFAFAGITGGQWNTFLARHWSDVELNTGYSVGGGVDLMLQDDWVIGAEYRHYNFGETNYGPAPSFQARTQETDFNAVSFRLRKKY
ncbi:MAG: porin family protein [Rhizobiaceae bacterium]|nr:porin family protein [Rhizobiaceae bacterium]